MDVVIIGAGGFGREVLDVLRSLEAARAAGAGDGMRFSRLRRRRSAGRRTALAHRRHPSGANSSAARTWAGRTSWATCAALHRRRRRLTRGAGQARRAAGGSRADRGDHGPPLGYRGRRRRAGAGHGDLLGVRVTTHVRIGRHLNLTATVGHDTVVEDYVTVNPLAAISGDVILPRGVTIGTTACVNQGLTVGEGSVVCSGAAVVRDVGAGLTVVGVPARPPA